MLPFVLAAVGGYLVYDSLKAKKYADGGEAQELWDSGKPVKNTKWLSFAIFKNKLGYNTDEILELTLKKFVELPKDVQKALESVMPVFADGGTIDNDYKKNKLLKYIETKSLDKNINGFEFDKENKMGGFLWRNKKMPEVKIYATPFYGSPNGIDYEEVVNSILVKAQDKKYKLTGDLEKDAKTYFDFVENVTKKSKFDIVADEEMDSDSDGQTDKELYDAMKDMGYNFGKYGTSKFDESGFSEMAINLGYRWDDKKKVWHNKNMMADGGMTKGGKITIDGDVDAGDDVFVYVDGKEVVSWTADEIAEDDFTEETVREVIRLSKQDPKELLKRINNMNRGEYADGGMTDSKISDFKKRIKERYGKDGMYAENFSPEPTSKEIDKAVRMFLDWTDYKQKKFNPKDTKNVEIVGDIMLYNRGEAFYNLGNEKIVKEVLKSVKPQTIKMADGGMAKSRYVTNLDEMVASSDLKEKLKSKINKGDAIVAFSYTDYGGSFGDKVAIEYFKENHPKNIVFEKAAYNGQNAIVFGKVAKEFIEETEDYPLGYEDMESFYYEMQNEQEEKDFKLFLSDIKNKYTIKKNALNWLLENKSGYYSIEPNMVDISYSELENELEEEGLIKKKKM